MGAPIFLYLDGRVIIHASLRRGCGSFLPVTPLSGNILLILIFVLFIFRFESLTKKQ
jgi:hypothetical protein